MVAKVLWDLFFACYVVANEFCIWLHCKHMQHVSEFGYLLHVYMLSCVVSICIAFLYLVAL